MKNNMNKMNKRTLLVTLAMNLPNTKVDYEGICNYMVGQYLKLTSMDVYVCCLDVEKYRDLQEQYGERLIVNKYELDWINEDIGGKGMEEYLKLNALIEGVMWSGGSYDAYYLSDGDLYLDEWDEESYQEMISIEDVDVWTTTPLMYAKDNINPSYLRDKYLISIREDRLIYTNVDKLKEMCKLWLTSSIWDNMFNLDIDGNRRNSGEWYKQDLATRFMMAMPHFLCNTRFREVPRDTYRFTRGEKVIRKEDGKMLDRWWNLPSRWWSMDKNVEPLTKEEEEYIANGIDGGQSTTLTTTISNYFPLS